MKLAQALVERKEKEADISRIQALITEHASYLEEDGPEDFDMDRAFSDLDEAFVDLGILIYQINRTNNQTMLENGLTIMESIVLRDSLSRQLSQYTSIRTMLAYSNRRRTSEDELRTVLAIDKKKLNEDIEEIQLALKNIDLALQEGNWKYDLVEFEAPRLETMLGG